jgi:hypothetical protein
MLKLKACQYLRIIKVQNIIILKWQIKNELMSKLSNWLYNLCEIVSDLQIK